jgi:hypothetical protein
MAHLEDVLEWIRYLLPCINQMFVSLSHHEVEILVLLTRHQTIVQDAFLVVRHRTPPVSMECLEKGETCAV